MQKNHENGLVARVYNYILEQILSMNLRPGETINELEIAESCSTSRTPVRQALKQMDSDGLVVIHTNRHTEVRRQTDDTIRHLGEVRILFDWMAARLAMYYGSDADFDRLRKLAQQYEETSRSGNVRDIIFADAAFHMEIAEISENAILQEFMRELFLNIGLMQTQRYNDQEYALQQSDTHYTIVNEIASRDSQRIKEDMLQRLVEFYNLDKYYSENFFV